MSTATAIETTTEATIETFDAAGAPNPKKSRLARIAIAHVLANVSDPIELDDLAGAARMSRFAFCRRFQQECGVSPMRWLWSLRTALAAEMITIDPSWPLTDVAFACGFTSSAHFSRAFRQMFGESPSAYRRTRKVAAEAVSTANRRGHTFFLEADAALTSRAAAVAFGKAR